MILMPFSLVFYDKSEALNAKFKSRVILIAIILLELS